MDKSFAFFSSLHTGQNHLTRTKDLSNPAFPGKLDLDGGVHAGFLGCLNAFCTQILLQTFTSHRVVILKTGLVVHQDNLTFLRAFRGSESFRTMLLDHLENFGNHIRILRLVQNARNVEHAVLEELHGDFLFRLVSVALGQKNQSHRIMTEPCVFLGFLLLDSTTNLVSGAFASPQDALFFHFEQRVLNRELVQKYVRVHSLRGSNQNHHGGQCGSVHYSQGSTAPPIRFSKPSTEPWDTDR